MGEGNSLKLSGDGTKNLIYFKLQILYRSKDAASPKREFINFKMLIFELPTVKKKAELLLG